MKRGFDDLLHVIVKTVEEVRGYGFGDWHCCLCGMSALV